MELITTHKKIASAISGLGRTLKGLDAKTHTIAVSAINHGLEHNRNWELVTALVKVVGGYDEGTNKFKSRAIRATDMRNWFTSHLPIKWEHKANVGRYVTDKKKLAAFDEAVCLESINTPWYEKVKDEGAPVKIMTIEARTKNYIKTIKADMKKALDNGIDYKTEVNDKLVGELLALINFDAIIDGQPEPVNDELQDDLVAELVKAG